MHYGIPASRVSASAAYSSMARLQTTRILGKGSNSYRSVTAGGPRRDTAVTGLWPTWWCRATTTAPNVPELPPRMKTPREWYSPSMRDCWKNTARPGLPGCHRLMDPIGFALETFDAVGRFRVTDNGATIDAQARFTMVLHRECS